MKLYQLLLKNELWRLKMFQLVFVRNVEVGWLKQNTERLAKIVWRIIKYMIPVPKNIKDLSKKQFNKFLKKISKIIKKRKFYK